MDPFIKTPKNHTIDLTVQRELPGHMIVEVGYVGRLGRELYQSVNLNQIPYLFKDNKSGQSFAQAYDALATELRSGVAASAVASQPWFENILVNLAPVSGSRTRALAAVQAANLINGNLFSLFLGGNGINARSGLNFINPQAQEQFFRTSIGRSNYHALVAVLRKRFSNNLTANANYTFSRSTDQVGAIQNSAGLMPNSFFLDAEYTPSAFDTTHIFNADFVYELPIGQGQRFAHSANPILSRAASGWYVSGIYRAQSGTPITIVQSDQVWGGTQLLGNSSGAIGLSGANFATEVHRSVFGAGSVATSGNPKPASGAPGTALNLFADPTAVFNSVRRVLLSQDTRSGRNALRGLGLWNLDMSVGKTTRITETVKFGLAFDFINVFNHVSFANPSTSLQSPTTFGVINAQTT